MQLFTEEWANTRYHFPCSKDNNPLTFRRLRHQRGFTLEKAAHRGFYCLNNVPMCIQNTASQIERQTNAGKYSSLF